MDAESGSLLLRQSQASRGLPRTVGTNCMLPPGASDEGSVAKRRVTLTTPPIVFAALTWGVHREPHWAGSRRLCRLAATG
jgi:hypothetical protein